MMGVFEEILRRKILIDGSFHLKSFYLLLHMIIIIVHRV